MTLSPISNRHKLVDCIFLFLLAALPFLPAVYSLGFHSDDWRYLLALEQHPNSSLTGLAAALLESDSHFGFRPIQLTFLLADYKFFGLNPTGYYICLALFVAITPVTVYLMMVEVPLNRWLALSTALIFGFLPHYATDRFWISSQQANFCIAFACLGLFALLRSAKLEGRQSVQWAVIGTVLILLSFLSYEVALGLIVVGFIYAGWRAWLKMKDSSYRNRAPFISFVSITLVLFLLGVLKTRSQNMIIYHHNPAKILGRLGSVTERAITQAVQFNCWTYGLHMPIVIDNMAKFHALTLPSLITSLLVGIAVSFYMWKFVKYSPAVSLRNAGLLVASGFAIFWLGYLLFAFDRNQDFNSAGLANRVTIASALGTALIEIAVVALVCSVFQFRSKMLIFSCAVGAVCAVNCLATLGIAWFWQDAARQRNAVFQSFSTHVHNLPVGSVLLLDGFCRYSGPGVIFEEAWDGTGAVQIGLRNFTLIGDVISPTLSVGDRALYADDPDRYYPYGPRLYVYNVLNQSLVQLGTRQAAQNYFSSMNPNLGADCPAGRSNFGSPIF